MFSFSSPFTGCFTDLDILLLNNTTGKGFSYRGTNDTHTPENAYIQYSKLPYQRHASSYNLRAFTSSVSFLHMLPSISTKALSSPSLHSPLSTVFLHFPLSARHYLASLPNAPSRFLGVNQSSRYEHDSVILSRMLSPSLLLIFFLFTSQFFFDFLFLYPHLHLSHRLPLNFICLSSLYSSSSLSVPSFPSTFPPS